MAGFVKGMDGNIPVAMMNGGKGRASFEAGKKNIRWLVAAPLRCT